jgi:hypothetical protein
MHSLRLRVQSDYERKMIFEKEEWNFQQSCSAMQEARRKSLALAKLAASSSGQDDRRSLSDDGLSEKRDATTGYRESQSLASPSSIRLMRSPRSDHRIGSITDPVFAPCSALWIGKAHLASPSPKPVTPRSEASLIDFDEDDEQHEPETETDLADGASLVEIPL